MRIKKSTSEERDIYDLFQVGVFLKGIQAIVELIASLFIFFIPLRSIVRIADHLTEGELNRDPDDFIATHLAQFAHSISIGGKEFAAIYLLLHGTIKIVLVVALLSGKRWAYPTALVAFGTLILYQLYRIILHHSIFLMVFTFFDCVVFYFIWREYSIVRAKDAQTAQATA